MGMKTTSNYDGKYKWKIGRYNAASSIQSLWRPIAIQLNYFQYLKPILEYTTMVWNLNVTRNNYTDVRKFSQLFLHVGVVLFFKEKNLDEGVVTSRNHITIRTVLLYLI